MARLIGLFQTTRMGRIENGVFIYFDLFLLLIFFPLSPRQRWSSHFPNVHIPLECIIHSVKKPNRRDISFTTKFNWREKRVRLYQINRNSFLKNSISVSPFTRNHFEISKDDLCVHTLMYFFLKSLWTLPVDTKDNQWIKIKLDLGS